MVVAPLPRVCSTHRFVRLCVGAGLLVEILGLSSLVVELRRASQSLVKVQKVQCATPKTSIYLHVEYSNE